MMSINSVLLVVTLLTSTFGMHQVPAEASARCATTASRAWPVDSGMNFTVEAVSDGPNCAMAALLLVIRNSDGEAIWVEASRASDLLTFGGIDPDNIGQMTAALKDWITASGRMTEAGALPDWKEGADAPGDTSSEFPFYTDEGMSRDDYQGMRKAKRPLFCYVQGMESQACVVLMPDGVIVKVGVQTFPG